MVSWPYEYDSLSNPTATDKTNSSSVPHAQQHANLNDIVEAIQLRQGRASTALSGSSAVSTNAGDVFHVYDSGGRTHWGPRAKVALADTLLSSTQASVTFSNIPQTLRNLHLIAKVRTQSSAAQVIRARLNGDTSTNYASQLIAGITTSITGSRSTSDTSMALGAATPSTAPAGSYSGVNAIFYDYRSTASWKVMTANGAFDLSTVSTPQIGILNRVSVWASTAAITSMEILNDAGDLAAGTRLTLYGEPGT